MGGDSGAYADERGAVSRQLTGRRRVKDARARTVARSKGSTERSLMGIHIGFIAATATRAALRKAFCETWPTVAVVASDEEFPDADALRRWRELQERLGAVGKRPGEVLVFRQHARWATIEDPSYDFASDEAGLQKLSGSLRTRVVSFVVETAGGSASFWCFEHGKLRRKIVADDAPVETAGAPLTEEAGLPIHSFYMNEVEALWSALGLTPSDWLAGFSDCEAVRIVSTGAVATGERATAVGVEGSGSARPWWKFW